MKTAATHRPSPRVRPRRLKIATTVAIAGFLLGVGAQAAVAGDATGSTLTFTVAGAQFQGQSHIYTSSAFARADTSSIRLGGGNYAGSSGAQGRLYTSGNALSCAGSYTYNSGTGPAVGYSCVRTTQGGWNSYGNAGGWNGSSYNYYVPGRSPNQNS